MASDSQAQTGSAADRERYITERADQLARIYEPLLASSRQGRLPRPHRQGRAQVSGPDTYRVEPITAGKVRKGDKLLMVDKFGARVIEVLTVPEKSTFAYLAETRWENVEGPISQIIGYHKQTVLKVHDDG